MTLGAQLQWDVQIERTRHLSQAVLARAQGGSDADAARELAKLRQLRHALLVAHPDLPMTVLKARLGLSDLEEEILWFALARSELAPITALPPELAATPLTRPFVAAALAETDEARGEALAAMSAEGRLWRTGLLRVSRTTVGDQRVEVLTTPSFLPYYLLGQRVLSEPVAWCGTHVAPESLDEVVLSIETRARAVQLAEALSGLTPPGPRAPRADLPAQLATITGPRGSGKTTLARAIATAGPRRAILLDAPAFGALSRQDQDWVLETLFAEALACGESVIIDRADVVFAESAEEGQREVKLNHARLLLLLDRLPVPVILTCENAGRLPTPLKDRALAVLDLPPIGRDAARTMWRIFAPGLLETTPGAETVIGRATLTGRGIRAAAHLATQEVARLKRRGEANHKAVLSALESACEAQQTSGMSETTTRLWIQRSRADLELPDTLSAQVDEIIRTELIRERTLEEWGLAKKLAKGLGLVCLFDGEPGTGKTLAAEVIASELALPLYTVNVANVVSKWLGETEKNLQRVFEDAARNRCLLLFDEADALFSKRTSVERSIDRFSNMEINLLLQLVEAYRGIVVLTTNLKDAIDPAFARRFAFKLTFELPSAEVRQRIWTRLLPHGRLAADVDADELGAVFELSGGGIRNVVLRASYHAAARGRLVDQATLEQCAIEESRALGRLIRTR